MSKRIKLILILVSILLVLALIVGIVALMFPEGKQTSSKTVSTMGYGTVSEPTELTTKEGMAGYVSVIDYGADPTDDKDDTEAFEKAIAKNIGLYVPAGTYYISRPIALNDQNLLGDGESASYIIGRIPDKKLPILYLGGSSVVSFVSLSYDSELITGDEERGERVAISCGAAVGFGPGGGARNITVKSTGTAIYSDNSEGFGSNNCTYENITVDNVTFRGFDFIVMSGYGNLFRQIEVCNSNAESAFYFDGFGGTDQIENITLKKCNMKYAVGYTELAGVTVGQLITEESKLSEEAYMRVKE